MQGSNCYFSGSDKSLSSSEVARLYRDCVRFAETENSIAVREFFVIDLLFSTGLRVQEVADLNCGDISDNLLVVLNGKCGKSRIVRISSSFATHVEQYKAWKISAGEDIYDTAPLITNGRNERISVRGLQKMFSRCLKRSGINGHSIHHARHTYAVFLLKATNYNLRLVQKQLGHSSIQTMQVYADLVSSQDTGKAFDGLDRLYG